MKRIKTLTLIVVLSLVMAGYNTFAQTAEELLPKAIQLEEVKGELYEAIETYRLILNEYPGNREVCAEALLHLGICYEKLGLDKARQTYRQVISKYPEQEDKVAMARERISRMDVYTAELLAKAEEHLKKGNELFKHWEYEEAIKEYENAVSCGPNTQLALNARYFIGQSWYRAGKYDEALATFTKLIEENPKSNIAPVSELMVAQIRHTLEEESTRGMISAFHNKDTIKDPETGITYRKIKAFTGESDIITHSIALNLSPNGKFLLCENKVIPMDGTAPFDLIDYESTGVVATRGTWSPDGTKAAFYSGDALCVVPVSPETGQTTGPLRKIKMDNLQWENNPSWSPDSKRITYNEGDKGDLCIIDADGSNSKQITTTSDIKEHGPAWSPDNKTIAYGIGNRSFGLYDIEKDKFSEFADVGFRCFPVWSPDGKWLLVEWQKLYLYNLFDKSKFEFSQPEETGNFFSWSSEGRKMLFFRTSYFNNSGLKIASSEGGPSFEPVHRLTNWGAAWWSDNNKLIAIQGQEENGDIAFRIVPLTGGESFLINLDNLTDGTPFPFTISSDLNTLLFTVDRDDGKEDLYSVPVSAEDARITGPAVKIFDAWYRAGAYNIIFSFSPNGEKVALIHEGDIWIAYTNGDNPIQISKIPERGGYLRWTPDSKALLIDISSGWSLLENPGPQGRIIKLLDEGKKIECPQWNIEISPDNTRFAVLTDENIKIIFINDKGSTEVLDISSLKLKSCYDLKWSPDGKNLAFIGTKEMEDKASFPDGKTCIYNIPVDGGPPVRVAPDDDDYKWALSWSCDGKWIAYSPEKPVKVRPESTIWEADFDEILEKMAK
ncbi:MAG: PD40 domain-containing protein [Bacteroidales bacterium]|nr:PD40 domain-containing protein [Bacteroidales bacterium]